MIQFNLLPDVKIEYIKARRLKRLIATGASAVMAGCVAITVLLFVFVNLLQAKHLQDLNKDIATDTSKISKFKDLDKILTVQNQLSSLPGLHASKPVASRLFTYVNQVTPANVSIATVQVDLVTNIINFTGSADSLASVNTFTDTLKFTEYQKKGDTSKTNAFSQVVLSSFGRNDKGANYTIDLHYDPLIFNNSSDIDLIVPKKITTRSETEKPSDLFKPIDSTTNGSSTTPNRPTNKLNDVFNIDNGKGTR